MSEHLGGVSKEGGEGPQAGGMPAAVAPTTKRFFLIEYLDEVRRGITWMRTAPKPEEAMLRKVQRGLVKWSKLRKARVGMVVLVLIAAASWGVFAVQAGTTETVEPGGPVGPGPTGNNMTQAFAGSVMENGNATHAISNLTVSRFATFRATLSWTDEAQSRPTLTNQPDQLGITVIAPNGANWTVAPTTTSPATWNLADAALDYGVGTWTFEVVGGTMGDVTRAGGLPCFTCAADSSNSYSLRVEAAW
jgi:hypothetical protein